MVSHSMLKLSIPLVSFLVAIPSIVRADILRCKGDDTALGFPIPVRIDVVLPESKNLRVNLSDENGKYAGFVADEFSLVGKGTIEIKYADHEPSRHIFVMTRRPSKVDSLVGFYIFGTYVMVLRVDTWIKGKPFSFYDPRFEALTRGRCE